MASAAVEGGMAMQFGGVVAMWPSLAAHPLPAAVVVQVVKGSGGGGAASEEEPAAGSVIGTATIALADAVRVPVAPAARGLRAADMVPAMVARDAQTEADKKVMKGFAPATVPVIGRYVTCCCDIWCVCGCVCVCVFPSPPL